MIIRHAEPEDVFHVAANMRHRDFEEISALRYTEDKKDLAYNIANNLAEFETVYCVEKEPNNPIAIISYIPVRPGVWTLGMFATDKFKTIGPFLTKQIIRAIIPALDRARAHRVEAYSIEGYDEVHRWLKFLGLKEECTLKKYGKNGEDFKVFSYVRLSDTNVKWRRKGMVA